MIPGTSFRTDGRTCVRIAELNGAYLIEPMRFLFPFEAKREREEGRRRA